MFWVNSEWKNRARDIISMYIVLLEIQTLCVLSRVGLVGTESEADRRYERTKYG